MIILSLHRNINRTPNKLSTVGPQSSHAGTLTARARTGLNSSPAPANPHRLLASGEDLVSSQRAPPEKLTREIRCWKFPLESISIASLLSFLVFFSLMLARWNLPLLLFVLCWLIGWLVAFYQRLKVDSFSHTRLASGFRAAVWTGERGRNWASAGKLSEGKLIEHETTFNFGPFFFCLRRGIVNTCWGLYLDSILFNSFEECLIFTAIDTHTSGIAIWHFGLTFFFLI